MEKEFEKHIGHRLRMLNNGIGKFFAGNKPDCDMVRLTHSQCAVMHYLYDHREEAVFQKDLENFFQISGATASNTLKGMEKLEVIERITLNEDARKKRLCLTEKGIRIHEAALSQMRLMEDTLTKGMTEEEIAAFAGFLERATQNMEAAASAKPTKK